MAQQKQGKGKRAWTTARAASNANANKGRLARKEHNRSVQTAAAKRNKDADFTPWDIQKEKRFAKRLAARR